MKIIVFSRSYLYHNHTAILHSIRMYLTKTTHRIMIPPTFQECTRFIKTKKKTIAQLYTRESKTFCGADQEPDQIYCSASWHLKCLDRVDRTGRGMIHTDGPWRGQKRSSQTSPKQKRPLRNAEFTRASPIDRRRNNPRETNLDTFNNSYRAF